MSKFEKEIRIALVISGGVSLATYMHGVTKELFKFIKAKCPKDHTICSLEECAYYSECNENVKTYVYLKNNILKADVKIDIISGTSAGGINGVLLATALVLNCDIDDSVSKLWVDKANIYDLLDLDKESQSILNSTKMEKSLEETFEMLIEKTKDKSEEHVEYLDLFVTAVNTNGYEWQLNNIIGKNYLHRFHLKVRETSNENQPWRYSKNDIKDNKVLLPKICRSTSAIPGVFEPVEFTFNQLKDISTKDILNYDLESEKIYLFDGGLMDNKPFKPVIDSLERISSDKNVERWIVFIDPIDKNIDREKNINKPNFKESLIKGYLSFNFQSIYSELLNINGKRKKKDDYKSFVKSYSSIINEYNKSNTTMLNTIYNKKLIRKYIDDFEEKFTYNYDLSKSNLNEFLIELKEHINLEKYCLNYINGENKTNIFYIESIIKFFNFQIIRVNCYIKELKENESKDIELDLKKIDKIISELVQSSKPTSYNHIYKVLYKIKNGLWNIVEFLRFINWMIWNPNSLNEIEIDSSIDKNEDLKKDFYEIKDSVKNIHKLLKNLYLNNKLNKNGLIQYFNETNKIFSIFSKKIFNFTGIKDKEFEEIFRLFISNGNKNKNFKKILLEYYYFDAITGTSNMDSLYNCVNLDIFKISSDNELFGLKGKKKLAGEEMHNFSGFLRNVWRSNDIMWGRLDTVQAIFKFIEEHHNKDALDDIKNRLYFSILDKELKNIDMKKYKIFNKIYKSSDDYKIKYKNITEKVFEEYDYGNQKYTKTEILSISTSLLMNCLKLFKRESNNKKTFIDSIVDILNLFKKNLKKIVRIKIYLYIFFFSLVIYYVLQAINISILSIMKFINFFKT
ncbi:MAG: DUF3376 domain-containing protein [Clostridiales bacterium]